MLPTGLSVTVTTAASVNSPIICWSRHIATSNYSDPCSSCPQRRTKNYY